jgi:hypothetical protein
LTKSLRRQNEPKYFACGHDTACSQFDEKLLEKQPDVAVYIFCGIGDASHSHAILANIVDHTTCFVCTE